MQWRFLIKSEIIIHRWVILAPGLEEKPMNAEHAWQATLGQLQLEMSKASFDTWVSCAEFLNYDEADRCFEIGVKNAYAKDWIEDRLSATMKRTLTGMMGCPVDIKVKVWSAAPKPAPDDTPFLPGHNTLLLQMRTPPSIPVTASIISLWVRTTGWHTPPVWPLRKARPAPTTPCSCTGVWG